jgi:inorganic phosphate transporter, PiT family
MGRPSWAAPGIAEPSRAALASDPSAAGIPSMETTIFYVAIGLILVFAFINGFHDGCNVIATVISSRSMDSRKALFWAVVAEFVGPLVLGTAVAGTIATRVLSTSYVATLSPDALGLMVIAAVVGAIVWNLITWVLGMPSSSSHALIGGLVGAGIVCLGPNAIAVEKLLYGVVVPLFVSPLIGGIAGMLVFVVVRRAFGFSHPSVRYLFVSLQKPGMIFLAASHGSNDAQKSMGLIGLILAAGSLHAGSKVAIPTWAMVSCAAAIALGLSTGGWRIIRTVGYGIFRMQPIHSFASQASSTAVILTASIIGGPVSTTQVVASSVIGVGASRRLSAVRWAAARNIAYAWLFTIPAAGTLSAGICWVLLRVLGR